MVFSFYKDLSIWTKLLLFVCFLLVIISLFKKKNRTFESFSQAGDFLMKEGSDLYDPFYVDIYDHLVYSQVKDNYEIGEIINKTSPTRESVILDVGSGTGHHVNMLSSKGFKVTGIDISESMIKKSKETYKSDTFILGDVLNTQQFKTGSFTHILCLYFSIYYFKNKTQFFNNCMKWLKPGGYLVLHLVDREQFDPILPPGNPLFLVSPQRYAKKRITQTTVVFDDMEYVANFNLNEEKDEASFDEKFTHKTTGKVRKNKHLLYMEPDKNILTKAQNAGFIYQAQIDLIKCGYEYQYLHIFVKPT
jgi:SAM-dependent methyltransferase